MRNFILTTFFLLILIVILTSTQLSEPVEGKIDSNFSYTPSNPEVDEKINFKANTYYGGVFNYTWDFGDGTMGYGHSVDHSYDSSGYFNVVLVTSNSTGVVDTYFESVYVASEYEIYTVIPIILFVTFYLLFYVVLIGMIYVVLIGMIGMIILGYVINPLVGGILGYKAYKMAKEMDEMETAKPYLLTILIAGIVSLLMVYLWLIAVIVHIVAYKMLKNKLKEKEKKKIKKKKKKAIEKKKKPSKKKKTKASD